MSSKTVTANLKISNYGNRVLGIIKEKYNLKDKSQALNKMLDIYGPEFLDREVKDEVVRDMIKEYNYDVFAKYYDVLEGDFERDTNTNKFLHNIFKKYNVKSVGDLACGTGTQIIYLSKLGYNIKASDFSEGMLDVAKQKLKKEKIKIKLVKGDMRNKKLGTFDAVITIFNAIGHLSKNDFVKALKNIKFNLNKNGLYVFDIFNLDYMIKNFRRFEFIDCAKEVDDLFFVRFNNNTLDTKKGILHINQKIYFQKSQSPPKIIKEHWDLKIYKYSEILELLNKNGFDVLNVFGTPDLSKFNKNKNISMYIVAKTKNST